MRRMAVKLLIANLLVWPLATPAGGQTPPAGPATQTPPPGQPLSTIPTELQLSESGSSAPLEDGAILPDEEGACCDDGACSTGIGGESPLCWFGGAYATGWIEQGFTWNPDDPTDRFNTPVTFNDRANEYQLNQGYLTLARDVDRCGCTVDLGGRVDLLWGSDYFFTTSTGLETRKDGTQRWNRNSGPRGIGAPLHGLSMPQLYAELFLPIWQGFSVQMGHFYSNMGYESVMAPRNFFYSHSYMFQYGEPKTYTGLLTNFKASRGLEFKAGFHRGWDAWQGPNDQLQFMGGVEFTSIDERWNFAFSITHGHEDAAGSQARTALSTVLKYKISPCTSYAFEYNYGFEEGVAANGTNAQWFGISQYLFHRLSPCTEMGMRFEWFRDVDNARVLGIADGSATGEDYLELSLGLNWRPCNNLMLRPELRWDWSDVVPPFGSTGVYNTFTEKNQFLAAVDLTWRF